MHSLALQTVWAGSCNPATCGACSTSRLSRKGLRARGLLLHAHLGHDRHLGGETIPWGAQVPHRSREVLVLWVGIILLGQYPGLAPCSTTASANALITKQGVYCWCWAGSTETSTAQRSAWGPHHTSTHGKRGPRVSSLKKRRKQQAESFAICTAYFMGLQTNPSAIKSPFSVIVRSIKTKWRLPLKTSFAFIYIIKAILLHIHLGFNSSGLDGLWTDARAFCGCML